MSYRNSSTSDAPLRAAAFIDPYWLLGRSTEPSASVVIIKKVLFLFIFNKF